MTNTISHLFVAALMAEKKTGKSWNELFDVYLKQPLGFGNDSHQFSFGMWIRGVSNSNNNNNNSNMYEQTFLFDGSLTAIKLINDNNDVDAYYYSANPAAGLYCTVNEYFTMMQLIAQRGAFDGTQLITGTFI